MINVGLWGPGRKTESEFVAVNRDIERVARECWGGKCLYARAYYTHDEFWDIYDREGYEALRTRFVSVDGEPMQVIDPVDAVSIPVVDLADDHEQGVALRALAGLAQEHAVGAGIGHRPCS